MAKCILVTGGAGYIGSHTCVQLLEKGYDVIVVDNYCNSSPVCLERVEKITNKSVKRYDADIRNWAALDAIFSLHDVYAVIHFAGLKAVGESVANPIEYYDNNVNGTLVLLDVMKKHSCKNIIFSSSATVYGVPERLPLDETCRLAPTNPYGNTKLAIETILRDLYVSDKEWRVVLLRYFNPVGAHSSGLIGEDPNGIPNNLTPYIAQVACGRLPYLRVYGNDYNTPDGTGVRDYIHIEDLASGHIDALEKLTQSGVYVYNLGTGKGYSVLDVLHAFEKACGKTIPYKIEPRRAGDIDACYADPSKANAQLGWKAEHGIDEMCSSLWKWQTLNPMGFKSNT
ncbi:MAG: UDP-glucose 4-epimerase GalE [Corallococcus sp.]|nr:UDP-glucose 4-epimerase GalE [Corallococcus sp.]